jgi:hypothetical protein
LATRLATVFVALRFGLAAEAVRDVLGIEES